MDSAHRDPAARPASTPVVVCIAETAGERARLAGLFDGVGVLVLAPDAESASRFLGHLRSGPSGRERTPDGVSVGGLRVDPAHHEATWYGRPLHLTRHELAVLGCLASSPGRVWTYEQLHERAWDVAYFTGPAAVQSVIKRLRAKLRRSGVALRIEAARGVGFRLEKSDDLHLVTPQGPRRGALRRQQHAEHDQTGVPDRPGIDTLVLAVDARDIG